MILYYIGWIISSSFFLATQLIFLLHVYGPSSCETLVSEFHTGCAVDTIQGEMVNLDWCNMYVLIFLLAVACAW